MSGQQTQLVADRYEIDREIGRGGMGVVLLATDQTLGRRVALKKLVLEAGMLETEEARQRFMREARLTSRLSHPNIVTLYDVVREGGDLYIVLEYYESRSLGEIVDQSGPIGEEQAAQIGAHVASALALAHTEGVVHRDVKPDNILVGAKGAKLTDFGIARLAEGSGAVATRITRTGYYVGTPGYMSPELIGGEEAGPASDVFSVGLVLYYAMTGEEPFGEGNPAAVLYRIVHEDLDLSAIAASPAFKATLASAIRKDPLARPDAGTFSDALRTGTPPAGSALPGMGPPLSGQVLQAPAAAPPATPPPAMPPIAIAPGSAGPGPFPGPSGPQGPPPGSAPMRTPMGPGSMPPSGPVHPRPQKKRRSGLVVGLIALLVLVILLGLLAVRRAQNPNRPKPFRPTPTNTLTKELYTSPRGFSVVLPPGWHASFDAPGQYDRFDSPQGDASILVRKSATTGGPTRNLSDSELYDTYVASRLQFAGGLRVVDDKYVVERGTKYAGIDAISIRFEILEEESGDRLSAVMYVFDGLDDRWTVLHLAEAGQIQAHVPEFKTFERDFRLNYGDK